MPPGTHSEFQANLYWNLGKLYLRRKKRKEGEGEERGKKREVRKKNEEKRGKRRRGRNGRGKERKKREEKILFPVSL